MKLRYLIHPFFTLTLCALLYTGCGRQAHTLIFLPPQVVPSVEMTPLSGGDTVSISDLYFNVNIPTREVHLAGHFSLPGNPAYALSLPDPVLTYLDKIKDIRVRPLTGYNSGYNALDDMTVSCTFSTSAQAGETIHKDTLIAQINSYRSGIPILNFVIRMTEPPSDVSTQQFIVEIITQDNARLADTTEKITISF